MVTKETPKTFYIGKLLDVRVSSFFYKPPQNEELDKAAPQRKGEENMWQCPFCGQDDFPELTEVQFFMSYKSQRVCHCHPSLIFVKRLVES
jgi:transcription elongation factor SPT6